MDLSNSQLDLNLDLAYDIEAQEDSNSLNGLKVYKLKMTKRLEHIIFCIFILQSANVLYTVDIYILGFYLLIVFKKYNLK